MGSFSDYLAEEKQKQIKKVTLVYILFGIPVILFFSIMDTIAVGIGGILKWRIAGIVPMVISFFVYLAGRIFRKPVTFRIGKWLLAIMITGVTGMMSALFYLVMVNVNSVDTLGLAGTIAGNLLAIFSVATLRAMSPVLVSVSLTLPYLGMVAALIISGVMSAVQWVFAVNILAAIPLVLIIINQRERSDYARLLALFNLENERANLESTVKDRTKELEDMLKELHHRVRNNLQIIISVVNLYRNYYISDKISDKRINMICKAVRLMSGAHDLSSAENIIKKINMKEFFYEICCDFYWNEDQSVQCDIDEIFLDMETAVILGFISIHLVSELNTGCRIMLTSDTEAVILSLLTDSEYNESSDDFKFALLLSELIRSQINVEIIGESYVTRILIPSS